MGFHLEQLDKKGGLPIPLVNGTMSLGRHPDNTVALPNSDRCVSSYHALIYVTSGRLLLQDIQSTNGTFVNSEKIDGERVIMEGDVIRLGWSGPRFRVVRDANASAVVDVEAPLPSASPVSAPSSTSPTIAFKLPTTRSKPVVPMIIAAIMLVTLILVISLSSGGNSNKIKPSSSPQNKTFFNHGKILSDSIDDNIGWTSLSTDSGSIEGKIDAILRRFGERNYQIHPDMVERVEYYLTMYTGKQKRIISTYLERRKIFFPMIRRIFIEKNIPLDLAYVSIVESGLDPNALSPAGALGLWQFMPKTAQTYGLDVSAHRDERTDPEKATYAAAAYFKDLIAVFGSRSAVMLCMAAYNAGEQRVINALKRIDDPVRDRDFWYLYKKKWLAEETNEYIPQILALIIISEHPEEYGFE